MRVNYDVDRTLLAAHRALDLGEFKDHLLGDSGETMLPLGQCA